MDEDEWSLGQSASCIAADETLKRAKEAATVAAAAAATDSSFPEAQDEPTSTSSSMAASSATRNRSGPNSAPQFKGSASRLTTAATTAPRASSRNPLHQFSAMPPSALIASQAKFEQAASAAVLVASRQAQLSRIEVKLAESRARLADSLGTEGTVQKGTTPGKPKKKKK